MSPSPSTDPDSSQRLRGTTRGVAGEGTSSLAGHADPIRLGDVEGTAVARALAHPARVRILRILGGRGECFCGDLCREFDLAQSTVSQHLKVLREAGLVEATPCGTATGYCTVPARLAAFRRWLGGLTADSSDAPRPLPEGVGGGVSAPTPAAARRS